MESRQSSKFTLAAFKSPRIKRKYLRKYSWLPDVLRLKGSIIGRIIGPVLTVTIFAALVAYAWSKGKRVVLTNSVVPLLSVVVGLILVFRNSTSYDRFWEGRKCFSSVTSNVRNLSRMIWIHVSLPPAEDHPSHVLGKTPTSALTTAQLKRQKIEVLQFCVAFAFAVKHYLRNEDGPDYDDYTGILSASFTRIHDLGYTTAQDRPSPKSYDATSSASDSAHNSPDATKRVRRKRSKKMLVGHATASASTTPLLSNSHQTVEFHPYADRMSIPFPLLIAHELSSAIFRFKREGLLETVGPAGMNAMSGLVQSMVDQMTSMERVANTPIPAPYGIHLKQCVTLYLFALPFTLVNDLGWSTIPIVTVVAFTLMGIEGIADEIEMPFGCDAHDLPLDTYCDDLREEIEFMIERLPEGGHGAHGYDDGEGDD
ncbi:Bestrophin, RFP-TM, chloride channel-domain-containing protein [Suillus fuscotomentosus]|uniref:Bestrophin, RFP-TM, chloride channel-domain-containing protein n=1 Tax=Suillus fuscotomentosus TaxID=1912939 RepID=A0AAD4ECU0_9AGAM|nr:Bestrophin, RFP-TM, chloride channel-domain-containing protein [Suillus fuscotomentosus]KAG1903908.1 Bestrophin, RFP-TM, chloride channel-domain-containing protein [Suillus fuscotomentosus]